MSERTERWRVGNATITAVVEAETPGIPPELFFPESSAAAVAAQEWLPSGAVGSDGTIALRVQAFVIEAGSRTVLVDPCVGNGKRRTLPFWHDQDFPWLERFEAAGFQAGSVDEVVHTHLHADHVGWDTQWRDGGWVPTFTRARHLYVEEELAFWRQEERRRDEDVFADSIEPILEAGLADIVAPDQDLGDGLRLVPTPGHTPGHVSLEVTSDGATAVITGDLTHHHVQLAHPEWTEVGDSDPELARETRAGFFARHADAGTLVLGTHWPEMPAGRLERHGTTWRFVAEPGAAV